MIITELNLELDKIRSLIDEFATSGDQHHITNEIINSLSNVRKMAEEQHLLINARLNIDRPSRSYAEAAKKGIVLPPKGHQNLVTVIVKSKSKEATGDQTLANLKCSIDPASLGIKVAAVKNTRSGAIAIALKDNCSAACLRAAVLQQESLDCHEIKKRNPYIRVQYVPEDISNEAISAVLQKNNKTTNVRFAFENRIRDSKCRNVTFQLEPNSWQSVLNEGYINIAWHPLRVKNFISIVRCYKCQAFGHNSKKCSATKPICSWCSGFHDVSQCISTNQNGQCINCERSKADGNNNINTEHPANSSNCNIFKAYKLRIINNIAYNHEH